MYRPTHSSTTFEFVGATLTDQGTLVAAQQPNQWSRRDLSNVSTLTDSATGQWTSLGTETTVARAQFGLQSKIGPTGLSQSTLVPEFDNLLMVSPLAKSWKASKGAYIPLRYQQPCLDFNDTSDAGAVNIMYHPWNTAGQIVSGSTETLPPQPFPSASSQAGPRIVGTFSKLMRAGAVSIRGVAPTTTFSVTFRNGYEVCPPPAGPWSANLTPSCRPCDRAVEAYFRLRHEFPDVFESSWNRKGLLQKAVTGVAGAVMGKTPASDASGGGKPTGAQRGAKLIGKLIAPTGTDLKSAKRPVVAGTKARIQKNRNKGKQAEPVDERAF